MSKFVFPKTARNLSPLSLLVLAACNGDSTTGGGGGSTTGGGGGSTTGDDLGGGGYQSLSFSGNYVSDTIISKGSEHLAILQGIDADLISEADFESVDFA